VKCAEHGANTEEVRIQNLLGNLKRRDHSRDLVRVIAYPDRRTSIRKLHVALRIPYVYDYMTTLCRKTDRSNHPNLNALVTGQGEAMHRK
jgi:hypothetical protein